MELTSTDKKLLGYLYHNFREPLTEIAKSCKLSRDQVEYRIDKYDKQGLIRKYLTIFNFELLGYSFFPIIWIKTKNKDMIKTALEKLSQTISVGETFPDSDLYVNFIFKDKIEFEQVFYDFVKEHKENIIDHCIFLITDLQLFPLKMLGEKRGEPFAPTTLEKGKIKLDKKSLMIMKELEKNGRARIVDIAKKTQLSPEVVIYKLKQLKKNKVVLGGRLLLDPKKLGFSIALLQLKLRSREEQVRKQMTSFCTLHKHVNALGFGISEYDCFVQFFYQNEQELKKGITEVKAKFKDEIIRSSLLLTGEESIVNTLPF